MRLNWLPGKVRIGVFLKINYFLFPFLYPLVICLILLEAYMYSGFLAKNIFIPLKLILFLFVIAGVLVNSIEAKIPSLRKRKFSQISYRGLFWINLIILLVSLLAVSIFIAIDDAHFDGYVYTHLFHLQPRVLRAIPLMGIFILVFNLLGPNLGLIKKRLKSINFVFIIILVLLLSENLIMLLPKMFYRTAFVISHLNFTYDQKMEAKWGDFYNYMVFVRENTPEDAIIMYPPQKYPWMNVGNGGLIRYFLYPRHIVQNYSNEYAQIEGSADYVMIAWGGWSCEAERCHGWPKIKVPAEWMLYKKKNSIEIENKFEDTVYNPDDNINHEAWGLIKIKKE